MSDTTQPHYKQVDPGYCICGAPLLVVQRMSTTTILGLETRYICTKGEGTGCPR